MKLMRVYKGKNLLIKRCSKCGEYLPICLFRESRNPNWKDGRGKTCFICQNKNYVVVDRYNKGEDLIKDIFESIARKNEMFDINYIKAKTREELKYWNSQLKAIQSKIDSLKKDLNRIEFVRIKNIVESDPTKYDYKLGTPIYGIIYYVHNKITDRYYVGQTIQGFDVRYSDGFFHNHIDKKEDMEHSHPNELLKQDLELYGEDSFEFNKIFKVASNQYELDKLEAYYIDHFNSYEAGYNRNRGNWKSKRGLEDIEG